MGDGRISSILPYEPLGDDGADTLHEHELGFWKISAGDKTPFFFITGRNGMHVYPVGAHAYCVKSKNHNKKLGNEETF